MPPPSNRVPAHARSKRLKSLSHGRPSALRAPSLQKTNAPKALAARHTRRLIREHHTLQKQRAAALAAGDRLLAEQLAGQIEDAGGLATYQLASRTGQRRERGGDASAVLVGWLKGRMGTQEEEAEAARGCVDEEGSTVEREPTRSARRLKLLDVGALAADTAAGRSGLFEKITRIDLKSQERGILEQDFMERPLPKTDRDRFDVVSLSLVLNYVPEAQGRGEMLKRVAQFLQTPQERKREGSLPCLFIVLPASCVLNSRYMTEERLVSMLQSLGYAVVERKISAKLAYFLCVLQSTEKADKCTFKKVEVNAGQGRNNFSIVLENG